MTLLNWNPSKGEPYKILTNRYTFTKAAWRILSEEDAQEVRTYFRTEREIVEDIRVNLSCYVWKFLLIDDPTVTSMISDVNGETYLSNVTDVLTTYIDYPMNRTVELKIPLVEWTNGAGTEQWFGHIMWQVAKVYEVIYKEHWKEVGVYGHSLDDLAFGNLVIDKNNILELYMES